MMLIIKLKTWVGLFNYHTGDFLGDHIRLIIFLHTYISMHMREGENNVYNMAHDKNPSDGFQ